jgi:signal transduction histidine kinase
MSHPAFAEPVEEDDPHVESGVFRVASGAPIGVDAVLALIHELSNPLTVALASTHLLRARASNDDDDQAIFDELGLALRTIRDLTVRTRSWARGQRKAAAARVDAHAVSLDALSITPNPAGAPIHVHARGTTECWADRGPLVHIVTNLISNALAAVGEAPNGGVHVLIDGEQPDRVTITVRDDGPGVPPALRDRIFDPYFTTRAAGLGVGLAVTRAYAHAMGATLALVPSDGRGACFEVRLRRA